MSISRREEWPLESLSEPGGWRTAIELEQLLEVGFASENNGSVLIRYEHFRDISAEMPVKMLLAWTEASPFLLKIDRKSDLGRADFEYRYQFLLGGRPVHLQRCGYYVRRSVADRIFHLDDQMYSLLEAMDGFNRLPPEQRDLQNSWLTFAKVKGCASGVGATLDTTLARNSVVIPSGIGLDMREDATGALSFLPRCPELASEEFHQVFERNPGAEKVYSLDRPGLGRVRIVLTNEQQEVLRRMKRVRRVSGSRKEELKKNPEQVFDGIADQVEFLHGHEGTTDRELAGDQTTILGGGVGCDESLPYGDRVIGIGDFVAAPVPRPSSLGNATTMAGIWQNETSASPPSEQHPQAAESTLDNARSTVNEISDGQLVPATSSGVASVSTDTGSTLANISGDTSATDHLDTNRHFGTKKHLLVETNEDVLKYGAADSSVVPKGIQFEQPSAFRRDFFLHSHQQQGVLWLMACLETVGRRGVLMADDMGLGKTIQILTFLAWCIEAGKLPDVAKPVPPFRPVLVVVPLILLDTKTWEREMERFFEHEGAIFWPILALHGPTISRFRREGMDGKELDLGEPVLDLSQIMRHRVVITNYETIRSYQHSFAYCPNGRSLWSMIISDEAQEYKVPSSRISHAMKALKAAFQIACTGTPVENRLLDLWNVCDVIQPGLLSSAREFVQQFESRSQSDDRGLVLIELKRKLLFQQPNAFLLRRNKSEVAQLPPKHVIKVKCDMSEKEIDLHQQLLNEVNQGASPSRYLTALHRFAQMSQHPRLLVGEAEDGSATELVNDSSKLQTLIKQLHVIRGQREKAIIFARHRVMQRILSKVLSAEFGLNVRIINGETKSRGTPAIPQAARTRSGILEEFKARPGFNVVILSPFVAGIGLTITEANHVFHYGRWWNPAVESQATDRAYRIGQTKEVNVYLPILHDVTAVQNRTGL
ncbi:MAG: DEAD/DEAH box helicase [Bryobacteraceae bacterium]